MGKLGEKFPSLSKVPQLTMMVRINPPLWLERNNEILQVIGIGDIKGTGTVVHYKPAQREDYPA